MRVILRTLKWRISRFLVQNFRQGGAPRVTGGVCRQDWACIRLLAWKWLPGHGPEGQKCRKHELPPSGPCWTSSWARSATSPQIWCAPFYRHNSPKHCCHFCTATGAFHSFHRSLKYASASAHPPPLRTTCTPGVLACTRFPFSVHIYT